MSTLEKIESWIFSRIVESIWWQTLTPHMRSVAAMATDEGSRKNYRRTFSSVDQGQSDFSLDLWKKAFRDSCERQFSLFVHLLFAYCKSCIQLPITNHASAVISNLLTSKQ